MIAPPDSENERVSCCCQKTCWPKAKKCGASRDVHARYMYLYNIPIVSNSRPRPAPKALGVVASSKVIARAWIILRGRICACVLAIDLGFVTMPRVLHVCA